MIFDADVFIRNFRGKQKARKFISGDPFRERHRSFLCIMKQSRVAGAGRNFVRLRNLSATTSQMSFIPMNAFREKPSRCSKGMLHRWN